MFMMKGVNYKAKKCELIGVLVNINVFFMQKDFLLFVETLYNSRCTAYNGTALDNRGHTISCPQLFIEN